MSAIVNLRSLVILAILIFIQPDDTLMWQIFIVIFGVYVNRIYDLIVSIVCNRIYQKERTAENVNHFSSWYNIIHFPKNNLSKNSGTVISVFEFIKCLAIILKIIIHYSPVEMTATGLEPTST